MRGQAFVSFPSEIVAKEAFELVNGFLLYGKPIIIHFGEKKVK